MAESKKSQAMKKDSIPGVDTYFIAGQFVHFTDKGIIDCQNLNTQYADYLTTVIEEQIRQKTTLQTQPGSKFPNTLSIKNYSSEVRPEIEKILKQLHKDISNEATLDTLVLHHISTGQSTEAHADNLLDQRVDKLAHAALSFFEKKIRCYLVS